MAKSNNGRKRKTTTRKKREPIKSRQPLLSALLFLLLTASLIITLYLAVGNRRPQKSALRQKDTTATGTPSNTIQQRVKKPVKKPYKPRKVTPVQQSSHLTIYRLSSDYRQLTKHRLTCSKRLSGKARASRIIDLLSLPGEHGARAVLPRSSTLLSITFSMPLITVNLSGDIRKSLINSGATDEMLTVACLTNSFLTNYSRFNALQILIDGEKRNTLAGHIDISRPLGYQTGINLESE